MSEQTPEQPSGTEAPPPLPEANLRYIVQTFALQALIWTGHVPNPANEKSEPNLELAQFQIGLLEVLEQKTAGNLDEAEKEFLDAMLHNARMAFIGAKEMLSQQAKQPKDAPQEDASGATAEETEEPAPEQSEKNDRQSEENESEQDKGSS